jgi:GNAT superfamily N-acetyltransferase
MKIARARPEEAADLTRIAQAAKRHWGYPQGWMRAWAGILTVTPHYLRTNPTFVAAEDGVAKGFCSLRLEGACAHVDHLWVRPDAMGRGVGRALFARGEKLALEAGALRLRIESDPNAEGFYQAMGAATVGRRPAAMDGRERFLPLLEKALG